ncbi:stage III sporulation AC/AD family protein [Ruminococcus sp. Marseille-P6503]|uniref:stage III sporulation AC/AD family protein n=1 Tax=Ruminococcus sp. Marseille-P6503 TaxID=2364796 RepID=UPI001FAA61D0|nr:stage III sporulation AC/AD family protein [Ruminococcus sp. Marseille-P6503]
MDIIAITGFCLTACIICKVLEKNGSEIKSVLTLSAACIVILKIVGELIQVQSVIKELFFQAQMSEDYLTIIFKGLGICYITQLAGDCCRDCGESCIASQIELAGKVSMLIISLPLFRTVVGIVESLLI